MKQQVMEQALAALDASLPKPVTLLIGGGAALLLAHKIRLETLDIDAVPLTSALTPAELDPLVKAVARELKISPHWLNDYFNTFTYTLPKDFRERLVPVFRGKNLTALALGREDLLIMKCFAGREKDIGHARVLIRRGANTDMVRTHLQTFIDKGLPGADHAVRFLEDLLDEREV
ncbi:MAG: hypothetical protein HY465_00135 [Deltaproteobacteria bacterium]|nr:hypothetical protein [Deltaproteobacteria bacterium]